MLADQVGFHSFWTVEHHFLEEFSHCSNPEVLYGAVAARTKKLRLGYGVRLLPSNRVSARDVMNTRRIVVTRAALEKLQEALG